MAEAEEGAAERDAVGEEVALERIKDLVSRARTTWLLLIGFLAFVGLTLLSVRDADFFSITATTDLPILNVAIPTTRFFWAAALLVAVLHTYFQVLLLKLWDALADAPSHINGLKLGDRVFPWLVVDWALRYRRDDARSKRPLDWLARRVTDLVIWWLAPGLLVVIWVRSMVAHDLRITLVTGCALVVTLFATLRCKRWAKWRLRKRSDDAFEQTHGRKRLKKRLGNAVNLGGVALFWAVLAPLIAVGNFLGAGWHHFPEVASDYLDDRWPDDWPEPPFVGANLANAEIAIRPADWRDP